MQTPLALQQALYRHQQRQIDALVAQASKGFKAYEARYRRESRSVKRVVSLAEVHRRVRDADVVYVGDYHTLRYAQAAYRDLVLAALETGRRVVLALEFVEGRHQATLDRYLSGRLSDKTFLERIGHPYQGAYDIWPGFKPLFELAKQRSLQVIAIDRRAAGEHSLEVRDRYAATLLAETAKADDRPLVLALIGQYHVAPSHLPAEVKQALGKTARRHLVAFQNPEAAWWQLAKTGRADTTDAAELEADVVALFNASPIVCQRTFLDYCEAESGDAPIQEAGIASTVRALAKQVALLAQVPLRRQLMQLEVLTPIDLDVMQRLARRGGFTRAEARQLERHVLSGESAFVPRARAIWLSGFSLNHAAEEATHFVRHCAVGDAMDRDRPRADAFWARCMEEAIGFFGSKLVNPRRVCTSLADWAQLFETGSPEVKQTGAFVLALSSLHEVSGADAGRLVPVGVKPFNAVSHALGYLLGEALFQAHRAGRLPPPRLKELFSDRVEDGFDTFTRWSAFAARAPRARVQRSG